ncbi:MAG: hypothetical protein HY226_02615 [Candidatus Vogelbacteria bacterium]|nr:hypothetical protein [Candidatus Vogelbacteria bacterium]
MMRIVADDWKHQATGFKEIGCGGEAVIYKMRDDVVGKVFMQPDDLQFKGNKELQKAAEVRIEEMQKKIFKFPRGLPAGFVVPTGALVNKKKEVFGYVMPYVKGIGMDKLAQTDSKLTDAQIAKILCSLHKLVSEIHTKGVVIGDFNENNIIVDSNHEAHIVDTDSCQFGEYLCRNFMPHFVAPELVVGDKSSTSNESQTKQTKKVSEQPKSFVLLTPHTELTDWYSFMVIAMRLITSTGPYGGVLGEMDLYQRFLERATVFDRRVKYPMNAVPLSDVPRSVLELFFRFFYRGERFIPDVKVFDDLVQSKTTRRFKRRK